MITRPSRFNRWLRSLPLHIVLIGICLIWLLPAIRLLVDLAAALPGGHAERLVDGAARRARPAGIHG